LYKALDETRNLYMKGAYGMSATDMIYKIIDEKCLKQSAVARAAGYDPKKFNALLRGRKRLTSDDVVPICKALGVTPNELFGIDHPATPEKSA
jgi:plasmid maintenance system antidote protein VapI